MATIFWDDFHGFSLGPTAHFGSWPQEDAMLQAMQEAPPYAPCRDLYIPTWFGIAIVWGQKCWHNTPIHAHTQIYIYKCIYISIKKNIIALISKKCCYAYFTLQHCSVPRSADSENFGRRPTSEKPPPRPPLGSTAKFGGVWPAAGLLNPGTPKLWQF